MSAPGYGRDAGRALGIGGEVVARPSGDGGFNFTIPCHGCGPCIVRLAKKFPSDVLPRKLQQAGWDTRPHLKCPACKGRVQQEKKETKMAEVERTDAARRAHRAIIQWLEDCFDEAKGTYRNGMSDAKIAAETGAAVEYVARTREDYFGPLNEPPEIDALRVKIEALETKADGLIRDATAAATTLRDDVRKLTAELNRIIKANGWKA